jgi:hypothetical protein
MAPSDYKRFLNLLSTHGCTVDFREFRSGKGTVERSIEPAFRLPGKAAQAKADTDTGGSVRSRAKTA